MSNFILEVKETDEYSVNVRHTSGEIKEPLSKLKYGTLVIDSWSSQKSTKTMNKLFLLCNRIETILVIGTPNDGHFNKVST